MPPKTSKPPPKAFEQPGASGWQASLHEVIFENHTVSGRAFDIALLVLILVSIVVVCLESVEGIQAAYPTQLRAAEWVLTMVFLVEYVARLLAVKSPLRYAVSFFGVVDLVALLPSLLSLLVPGLQSLLVIRSLRMVRLFRIFQLSSYVGESRLIVEAIRASSARIIVFLLGVSSIVTIIGGLVYVVEGPENGFTSIPKGIYWGIVTLTTVGFGDITPKTPFGQFIASLIMLLGYGVLAVPTGIVTSELTARQLQSKGVGDHHQVCEGCSAEGHDRDARHCKFCGHTL
jgi:voltage-gated potassium channel